MHAGREQTCIVHCDIDIGTDNRESGTLFKKQKMGNAIIHFMIAKTCDIRCEQINKVDGGNPKIVRVNHGTAEHIPGHRVDCIFFFTANLIHITFQSGYAAGPDAVFHSFKEIAVHVICMQESQFFHNRLSFLVILVCIHFIKDGFSICIMVEKSQQHIKRYDFRHILYLCFAGSFSKQADHPVTVNAREM